MSAFESDTAAELVAPGRYSVDLSDRWWVGRGPNGGYVAALMLQRDEHRGRVGGRVCGGIRGWLR